MISKSKTTGQQWRADETYSAFGEQNGECRTEQPRCDAGGKEEHTLRAGAIRRREQFRGPEPVKGLRADSRRSSPGNGKGQQRSPAGRRKNQREPSGNSERSSAGIEQAPRHPVRQQHKTEIRARHRAAPQEHLQQILLHRFAHAGGRIHARHKNTCLAGYQVPEPVNAEQEQQRGDIGSFGEQVHPASRGARSIVAPGLFPNRRLR